MPDTFSCPMCGHAHAGGARECASCGEPMAQNVWRDGELVIASRDDAHWPAVCFLSGESTSEATDLKLRVRCGIWIYVVAFLTFLPPFFVFFGPVLVMLLVSSRFRSRKVSLPLSRTGRRKINRGKRWAIFAFVALLPFIMLLIMLELDPIAGQTTTSTLQGGYGLDRQLAKTISLVIGLIGAATVLIGIPIAAINLVRLFHGDFGVQLLKIEDGKFYLKGAHPRLLELLPAYEARAVSGGNPST